MTNSGLPHGVPGLTINADHGAGLEAVTLVVQAVRDGGLEVAIASLRMRDWKMVDTRNVARSSTGRPALRLWPACARPLTSGQRDGLKCLGPVARCCRRGGDERHAVPLASNEAVAAQACSVNAEKGGDTNKVNVDGSAMVIGHLIGASGCPEAVGGLILDLVCEEAAFVTGANIAINGGQHMR